MANVSNRPEPMTLIDLDSENLTRNKNRPLTFKKKYAFNVLLVMIPLLVTIIATVCIKQELKQMKIDFADEMKNTSNTFEDSFSSTNQEMKQMKIDFVAEMENASTTFEDSFSNLQQDLNQLQKDFNVTKKYLDQVKILNGSYEYLDIVSYREDGKILKLQLNFFIN